MCGMPDHSLPGGFELEMAAPGVWLARHRDPPAYSSNSAIFELETGLLVVDTQSAPQVAAGLVSQIREQVSAKPVQYVVYSHAHFDHVLGTEAYRQMWPGVKVVASRECAAEIAGLGAGWLGTVLAWMRETLEAEARLLGPDRTSAAAARWERRRCYLEEFARVMEGANPVPPDLVFEGELEIRDPLQPLRLLSFGRGHSDGDMVVLSPSRRAAATGDLAYDALPFTGVCYPADWIRALDVLHRLDFEVLLGGHGPAAKKECAAGQRRYLQELLTLAERARRDGVSAEEFAARIRPEQLRALDGGLRERWSAEPRALVNVPLPGDDPAQSFAAAVRQSAADLYARLAPES